MTEGADALSEALRPIVAELVAEEIERRMSEQVTADEPPFLTVRQYADRYHTTPDAIRARIRRGQLPEAFRPIGAREYLIPNDRADLQGSYSVGSTKCPRTAPTAGGVTPKE